MHIKKIIAAAAIGLSILGGIWIVLATAPPYGAAEREPGNSTRRPDDFEQRVRDYILRNPEVILESLQRLEQRRRLAQTDEIGAIIAARGDDIFKDPSSPVGGNPNGDVSLVEFFDYNCPYCRKMAPALVEIERGDPNLRLVYKEWPILGPNSEFAARAALASRNQGKYVEFHKAMMLSTGLIDESKVIKVARDVGLDVQKLRKDMQAPEIAAAIERNNELTQALRITGTPGFVIGDQMLRGAADIEVMRDLIRRARER